MTQARTALTLIATAFLIALPASAQTARQAQVPVERPFPDKPEPPKPGAAPRANAERGETIAKRWCAECHVVAPDQKSAKADVPTFSEIAKRRRADAVPLDTFLMNPHPRMPDMQLTRTEVADIAAFIRAQRAK